MAAADVPVPAARRFPFWRAESGFFIGLWLFFLSAGRSKLFQDAGTFWHTIVGERMFASGELIYTDPFTFTFAGRHWIGHQWLGEVLMGLLHRLDGLDTLLLFTATLLAGLYTWVAHRFLRAGLHWSLTAFIVVAVVSASAGHFHIRPHLATIVFVAVTMGYLIDLEAGRIGLLRMLGLIPIYLLWSNIHGGALGGLATMVIALAGWSAAWLVRRTPPAPRQLLGFAALIGACGLTFFITPYGTLIFRTWLAIMESETLTRIIIEHRPLNLENPDGQVVVGIALVYVVALLSTLPRWPRVVWLLPLVWLVLAWTRVRHAPLFAAAAALGLADMLPFTRFATWATRIGSDLYQPPEADAPQAFDWRPALLPVALVAVALGLQQARVAVPVIGHGWAQLDPTIWPIELLDDLRQHQTTQPDGTPIFNECHFGGFLIYHAPGFRVFVDDRCELYRTPEEQYRDEWLDRFVAAEGKDTATAIRSWENDYGRFNFALVRSRAVGEPGFDAYFSTSPEWAVVKRTNTATLYQRK